MWPIVTAEVHQCGSTVDVKSQHWHLIFDALLDRQPMECVYCIAINQSIS